MKNKSRINSMRLATIFSGIGAPEQAMRRIDTNFKTVFACEWDKFARQSYSAIYDIDEEHFHKDVNDLNGTQYRGKVDILVGGSPCQAFSIAGLRNGTSDERGQLIYQYIRIVSEVKAPIIVYENVKGMLSIDGGRTIKEFVQALRDIGYYCHYGVLNTKDYGVPQNRERIFLVGFLDHEAYHRFSFAPKQKLEKRLKDVLEDEVDDKYYLSQKMLTFFDKHSIKRGQPLNVLTGNDSSSCLTARYAKCGLNDPYIKDKIGIRKLTPLECWRSQDFPDEAHHKAKGLYCKTTYFQLVYDIINKKETEWNVKLKAVKGNLKQSSMETYALCTTKEKIKLEALTKIYKNQKIEQQEKTKLVNIVIERLEGMEQEGCVTNIIRWIDCTTTLYTEIIKKQSQVVVDIFVTTMGKDSTEQLWKITLEDCLNRKKLYTTLIVLKQIIESKIFTYAKANLNILKFINNSIDLEANLSKIIISDLRMEYTSQSVSDSSLYKQAGNTMSCNVLEMIFRQILNGKNSDLLFYLL